MRTINIDKCVLVVKIFLIGGLITSCFHIGRDYAKPGRRYVASWNDTIRTNCSEAYNDDCQKVEPNWKTPRKVYSVFPPMGEWEINDVFGKKNANYKFYYNNHDNVYYYVEISAYPATWGKKERKIKKTLKNETFYKEANALAKIDKERHVRADDISIKNISITSIKDNKCMKFALVGREGPDPTGGGPYAGLGSSTKTTQIVCYLKGNHEFWKFWVEYEYEIIDKALSEVDRQGEPVTPERIEEDFEERMGKLFDSIRFYGLSQKNS
jgi:hypothetical protein